jgi:dihydrofolate reductase
MARLIQWNLISLDGFFEGAKKWDLQWHNYGSDRDLEKFSIEQLRSAGMLLFGRVTYEGMAAYWKTAQGEVAGYMNRLPKVVVSRTLQEADWNNTFVIRSGTAEGVNRFKREIEGDIFVFGSAALSATLMRAGLFDEFRIALAPAVLGRGTPLFGRDLPRQRLKLLETRPLPSGVVILRYAPLPGTGISES